MKTETVKRLMMVGLFAGGLAARAEIVAVPDQVPAPGGGVTAAADSKTAPAEGKAAGAAGDDILMFQNGDRLRGSLISGVPDGFGVKWRSADIEAPLAVSVRNLDKVRLARKAERSPKAVVALVRLSNDDSLSGEVVSLQGDTLILKTSYAGNVTIRRAMLARVSPGTTVGNVVYEGPDDMAGWVTGEGGAQSGWSVKNGQLIGVSSYAIGRNLPDLPDSAEIQFTVVCDGPYLQFNVAFCTDNLRNIGGNTYYLQFGGNSGYLYRSSNNSGSSNLGQGFQIEGRRNMPIRKADVRILLSREKKTIALFINGNFVRQWTDPDGFPGSGKGLLFQSGGGRCRISGIRVAAWDGRLSQPGDSSDGAGASDSLVLANGDKISGKVLSIQGNSVKLETSYAPLDIPLTRIAEISFGKEGRQKARLNKNDIQCRFAGGGTLTVELVSLENGIVVGKSENFGDIKLSMTALEELKFNPWVKPAPDSKEPDFDPGELME